MKRSTQSAVTTPLTIALSKGRILEETLPLLAKLGITPTEDLKRSRKLIVATSQPNVKLVIIRAQDVPTYVEYGAADIGVAGKDVLLEAAQHYLHGGLYEPLDLDIARCRLVVAGFGKKSAYPLAGGVGVVGGGQRRLRVASKYARLTQAYFAARGEQVEVIKLYGSMELAPLVGLADRIVDLVDTGNTLKANGLVILETIAEISARLVVNKAAMKVKRSLIQNLIDRLALLLKSAPSPASGSVRGKKKLPVKKS